VQKLIGAVWQERAVIVPALTFLQLFVSRQKVERKLFNEKFSNNFIVLFCFSKKEPKKEPPNRSPPD